ncbi:Ldh family oxidoreductase [Siccirubricoccus sp. G192]|uniref:Ldh family oxidoreductase n=1 Tax=Siccirubricoccus sp. G192 TaxID=2849651 RepID=UPI001C2C324E|nr:Ldh family oxidoreductase [Siccirubricoccus sp. G192]MBV1796128.1 Ldh family oxidoreductase [Siccirubricoccus sp. G192]
MARVPAELVRRQTEEVLRAWGMPEDMLRTTAEVMTETDLIGVDSHGISMLPGYDERRRGGRIDLRAVPKVVKESPVSALIDAGAGLGHPASVMAMEMAIAKCRACGIASVGVRNSHHFGAAGYYAKLAADAGVVGFVTSSSRFVSLVPTRGAEPVLGTNPIAIAAPAARNPPVVLDMATSLVAINKVKVYALRGEPIPAGWVVDGEGRPMTDAAEALKQLTQRPEGGLAPVGGADQVLGGHKGYGLSLFAQILGGTLTGGSFSPVRNATVGPDAPDNIGHLFLALDPAWFRESGAFETDMDAIVDTLHAARPADPAKPVLVAGDPERITRKERLRLGIPLPETLRAQIRKLAEAAGAPYLLG